MSKSNRKRKSRIRWSLSQTNSLCYEMVEQFLAKLIFLDTDYKRIIKVEEVKSIFMGENLYKLFNIESLLSMLEEYSNVKIYRHSKPGVMIFPKTKEEIKHDKCIS